jgi:hypothetical protein
VDRRGIGLEHHLVAIRVERGIDLVRGVPTQHFCRV